MSRDKQIEEMAIDICPLYKEYGSCKKCDDELDIEDEPCLYKCMSKLFAEKGYRKESEVVGEIIRILRAAGINEHRYPVVAELKKKYTKEIMEEE